MHVAEEPAALRLWTAKHGSFRFRTKAAQQTKNVISQEDKMLKI